MKIEKNDISDLLQLFATHEIAVLVKKMGFNDHCFAYYDEKKELVFQDKPYAFWSKNDKVNWNRNLLRRTGRENVCAAPTWEQVVDFINVNTDYTISIEPLKLNSYDYELRYSYEYHEKTLKCGGASGAEFIDKKQANEKCILTVLNLILNDKKA